MSDVRNDHDEVGDSVIYEFGAGIAWISMNRPKYGNAQNSRMTYQLDAAFMKAVADDEVKVMEDNGNPDIVMGDNGNTDKAIPKYAVPENLVIYDVNESHNDNNKEVFPQFKGVSEELIQDDNKAFAMGNYFFTDSSGVVVKVEYTFGYKLRNGHLLIDIHHSSLRQIPHFRGIFGIPGSIWARFWEISGPSKIVKKSKKSSLGRFRSVFRIFDRFGERFWRILEGFWVILCVISVIHSVQALSLLCSKFVPIFAIAGQRLETWVFYPDCYKKGQCSSVGASCGWGLPRI